jgi:hypothetical protein
MKNKNIIIFALVVFSIVAMGFVFTDLQTNFERLVLGSANYGQDPNPTADITGQNDEQISNYTNGRWDFGSANILTTGTIGGGASTLTGKTALDSLTVGGEVRIGALVDYHSKVSIKNDAVNVDILKLWNSRAQQIAKVDSSGVFYSVGLTSTGAITATSQTLAIGAITTSGDFLSSANFNMFGSKTLGLGDSVSLSVGAKIADTASFTAGLATKAISIPGALGTDVYFVTKRIVSGTSTAAPTDSATLSYMALPDSLIVSMSNLGVAPTQAIKFSWVRVKLQ